MQSFSQRRKGVYTHFLNIRKVFAIVFSVWEMCVQSFLQHREGVCTHFLSMGKVCHSFFSFSVCERCVQLILQYCSLQFLSMGQVFAISRYGEGMCNHFSSLRKLYAIVFSVWETCVQLFSQYRKGVYN